MPRDYLEEHLFALAANQDRRIRLLERLRIAYRIRHFVVPAVERGFLLREHPLDNPAGLIEGLQALWDRLELESEALMLELEPS